MEFQLPVNYDYLAWHVPNDRHGGFNQNWQILDGMSSARWARHIRNNTNWNIIRALLSTSKCTKPQCRHRAREIDAIGRRSNVLVKQSQESSAIEFREKQSTANAYFQLKVDRKHVYTWWPGIYLWSERSARWVWDCFQQQRRLGFFRTETMLVYICYLHRIHMLSCTELRTRVVMSRECSLRPSFDFSREVLESSYSGWLKRTLCVWRLDLSTTPLPNDRGYNAKRGKQASATQTHTNRLFKIL